jgi:hypothetical protein
MELADITIEKGVEFKEYQEIAAEDSKLLPGCYP